MYVQNGYDTSLAHKNLEVLIKKKLYFINTWYLKKMFEIFFIKIKASIPPHSNKGIIW